LEHVLLFTLDVDALRNLVDVVAARPIVKAVCVAVAMLGRVR
jgi:hypothetical protein